MAGEVSETERPFTSGMFEDIVKEFEDTMHKITYQDEIDEITTEQRRKRIAESLRFEEFCDQMQTLFKNTLDTKQLKSIFAKISANPDSRVDWSEMFGIVTNDEDKDEGNEKVRVEDELNAIIATSLKRHIGDASGEKRRRDIIVCIRYVAVLDAYLVISQKGVITIWSASNFLLTNSADISDSNFWFVGCEFLLNTRRVCALSERHIYVWDPRAKTQEMFVITTLRDAPLCMLYFHHHQPKSSGADFVLFGDDQGNLNQLTLDLKDLNTKKARHDPERFGIHHVLEISSLSHPIVRRKMYDQWITCLRYFPHPLDMLAMGCAAERNTFFMEPLEKVFNLEYPIRYASVNRGVNAINFCYKANVFITGGVDKKIRVWHPHIWSRPTGKLSGHVFTITHIEVNERDQQIISLSTGRVFRVWDIHSLSCLQIFSDSEQRPGEKRVYCMMFDAKYDRLLTGTCAFDSWPLTKAVQNMMHTPHTHDRAINKIILNTDLTQLFTVCAFSKIKAWQVETGHLQYVLTEPHGLGIEVLSLAVDSAGYRLASGGSDGSIKVMDTGSGQEMKFYSLPPSTPQGIEQAVHVLMYLPKIEDSRKLLCLNFKNSVLVFDDSSASTELILLSDIHLSDVVARELSFLSIPSTRGHTSVGRDNAISLSLSRSNSQISGLFRKGISCGTSILLVLPRLVIVGTTTGHILVYDGCSLELRSKCTCVSGARPERTAASFNKRLISPTPLSSYHKTPPTSHGSASSLAVSGLALFTYTVSTVSSPENRQDAETGNESMSSGISPSALMTREGTLAVIVEENEALTGHELSKNHTQLTDLNDTDSVFRHTPVNHSRESTESVTIKRKHSFRILTSCHHDGFVRFWSLEGASFGKLPVAARVTGTPLAAVCFEETNPIMYVADQTGYVTKWNLSNLLASNGNGGFQIENPSDSISLVMTWRAHLLRVVSMCYIEQKRTLLTASSDGSVRLWFGDKSHYIGYFGQHWELSYPLEEDASTSLALCPIDILEKPIFPLKTKSIEETLHGEFVEGKLQYSLRFDSAKWGPIQRSAQLRGESVVQNFADSKFFDALKKPKGCNMHMTTLRKDMDSSEGRVFSVLPVYRVPTPKKIKPPKLTLLGQSSESRRGFNEPRTNQGRLPGASGRSSRSSRRHSFTHRNSRRASLWSRKASTMSSIALPPCPE